MTFHKRNLKIHSFVNDILPETEMVGDLAIDTEAMGLKTHRDRLCMIQIADQADNVFLIHFPENNFNYDCKNLKKYLINKDIQKIFHFARFDVAIIKHYLNINLLPNVFCTKIASKLTRTYTDKHSLRALVNEFCDTDLRKEQQTTNWGQENISQAQKQYAVNDVIYLLYIRKRLIQMLQNTNRVELANKYFDFLDAVTESDLLHFIPENIIHHTDLIR